ncbi:MAG: porphobilinogen synthase [Pelagibacterales bacterium]|nr:porphobilinogen synthase [Pelagibacterales bacterium]
MKNFNFGSFPTTRPRRLRQSQWIRDLVAENKIVTDDLILPLFVIEGKNKQEKITALPDVFRFSTDLIVKKAREAKSLGINALMLFPAIDQKLKNSQGSEAWNENNLICRTIKAIKDAVPEIGIIADVALDPYTSHGHDGIIDKNGYVVNDETIEALCKQALVQAEAGCDIVAPSDMMDGRIAVIRDSLDECGLVNTAIMSYAAKYASSFYGPFRNAVGSAANLGKTEKKSSVKKDKKTYQMDFRNSLEATKEISLDISEGADLLIIKPGMPYLDIIKATKDNISLPIVAYQVSGEYAMLKFAAANGAFDFDEVFYESLVAFKRAGSDAIITYGAIEIAKK